MLLNFMTDGMPQRIWFAFDHEQVRDQTNAFFAAIGSVLVMKFKALSN